MSEMSNFYFCDTLLRTKLTNSIWLTLNKLYFEPQSNIEEHTFLTLYMWQSYNLPFHLR